MDARLYYDNRRRGPYVETGCGKESFRRTYREGKFGRSILVHRAKRLRDIVQGRGAEIHLIENNYGAKPLMLEPKQK